jgi:nitrile hydratase alpha subunit
MSQSEREIDVRQQGGHDNGHHHDHHHDHHDHSHAHQPHPQQPDDEDQPLSYYQIMAVAVRELMIEKGIFTADEIRRGIEVMDGRPAQGPRIVARAWTDPAYKKRLMEDGVAAIRELGIEPATPKLLVFENTKDVQHVVVCTLCSCYPRMVLGVPPDWYKSRSYRSRIVKEPRAVLREFGTIVSDDVEVRVHDATADLRYLILPERPAGTEGWSAEQLEKLVTRDSLIGVAPALPATAV